MDVRECRRRCRCTDMSVEVRGQCQVCSSTLSPPYSFEVRSLITNSTRLVAQEGLRDPPVSSPVLGLQVHATVLCSVFFTWVLGLKLRSSCLYSKYIPSWSYLLSPTTSNVPQSYLLATSTLAGRSLWNRQCHLAILGSGFLVHTVRS